MLARQRTHSVLTRNALGLALHPDMGINEMRSLARTIGITGRFVMLQASNAARADFEQRLSEAFKDERTRNGRISDPLVA